MRARSSARWRTRASAYGVALLGVVAGGVFADVHEAVAGAIRTTDLIESDPGWHDSHAELHARYRALYPALRDLDGATVEL